MWLRSESASPALLQRWQHDGGGSCCQRAPVITDTYQPETVVDLASLLQRATLYGCAEPLRDGLNRLQQCLAGLRATWQSPLAIILSARRPFHLIGTDSAIELCPYIIEMGAPKLFPAGEATPVRPAAHRDAMRRRSSAAFPAASRI
jgi:hypothetical protein